MIRQMKLIVPVFLMLLTAMVVAADESLATARELYAAAAYEDALLMLNRLRATDAPAADRRGIEQYRAFCLLALGRTSDAERAIEAVVSAEPTYQPSDADMSPRLRTAFSDVRKRMLPGIIQDQYARAKEAFDQKRFEVAASTFKDMLTTLADPAVGAAATQPPLSDLRMLAVGFRELAAAAIAPPPPPKPVVVPPPVVAIAAPPPPAPAVLRIYSSQDADVQPPLKIRQDLPEYDKRLGTTPGRGSLEIVIGENGSVEQVLLRGSVHPKFDELAMAAARTWRYKPAMRQGVPVKYSKAIAIVVDF
jgi:TonB family protein